jgi:hypothetical protein
MGLFNYQDPEQAGLLALGAGLLSAGGPSTRPISLGQALGSGLMGGMQAMQDAEKQKLMAQHYGVQNEMLGMQKDKMALEVAKQKRLEEAYKSFYGKQPTATETPEAPPTIPVDDSAFPRQPAPDWMPIASSSPPAAAPTTRASTPTVDNYTRHLQLAQYFESRGLGEEASKYYDLAEKFRPKIKDQKTLMQNGKPVNVITYEDGRQEVSAYGAMPDNQIVNLGGKQIVVDKNAAANGQSWENTMTPGEKASNGLGWANHNLSRQQFNNTVAHQNQPQFVADLGGFVSRPTAQNPAGGFTPLNGLPTASKASEDERKAAGWVAQADNAWKNMQNVMYQKGPDGKILTSEDGRPILNKGVVKPGTMETSLSGVGLDEAANSFRGADRQRFVQASASLSESLLRAATGAGVNAYEAQQKVQELTPRVGDKDAVIQQKLEAIPMYLETLRTRAGRALPKEASSPKPPTNLGSGTWSITKVE